MKLDRTDLRRIWCALDHWGRIASTPDERRETRNLKRRVDRAFFRFPSDPADHAAAMAALDDWLEGSES